MEHTRLGKTDLKISRIGLGTWQFSEAWGSNFSLGLVRDRCLLNQESY